MNLLEAEWIPVRHRSGRLSTVSVAAMATADDPPIALAFPRADWNLAGLELLIGLVYLACPPEDEDDWREQKDRHDPDELAERFRPLLPWFSLDAENGPRFLQDLEPLDGTLLLPCERLFIDAPGAKTVKDNGDLMVKSAPDLMFSRATAAIALYAFQQFAPSGGAGNRTSMRGGGPMVTLVEPMPRTSRTDPRASLMEIVWANVPDGRPLRTDDADEVAAALPWTAPTRKSGSPNSTVYPPDTRGLVPHHVYFGMPRRIRLEFGTSSDTCDLTKAVDDRPVIGFRQIKHGMNYGQWRHPSTPYYRVKEGAEELPVHPKPGRFGYRQYRGIVLRVAGSDMRTRAASVETFARERQDTTAPVRLIVGGWAMDNMRALDFVSALEPAPLGSLSEAAERRAVDAVEAAEILGGNLAIALKNALGIEPATTDVVSSSRRRYYEHTDSAFHDLLTALSADGAETTAADAWRKALLETALTLFDDATQELVPTTTPEHARAILDARRLILSCATGYSTSGRKLFDLLGLEAPKRSRGNKEKAPL